VPVPLLYHDRKRQFVVQFFPFGLLDELIQRIRRDRGGIMGS
jgi:hypothetical protein